jgi:hypothetical protein
MQEYERIMTFLFKYSYWIKYRTANQQVNDMENQT